MMRKIVSIVLVLLYSVCSSGATIYLHHCGENTAFSFLEDKKNETKHCPLCNKNHSNSKSDKHQNSDHQGCCSHGDACKDTQVELKKDFQQENQSSMQLSYNLSPAVAIIPWILNFFSFGNELSTYSLNVYDKPQVLPPYPVYLLNRSLII